MNWLYKKKKRKEKNEKDIRTDENHFYDEDQQVASSA